ncbi:helix-turn-helix transcriptional regulator [Vibrio gangliei]|uniref:helix-turn-helix transcriptional regulator n=1 Tax=Vibrio gangliei TaxID=2077090 RepID=UPI000D021BA4|nr:AraC family transcriptional regulator [Vibrio gangliei]
MSLEHREVAAIPTQRGIFSGRVENLHIQDGARFHNKDIVHKCDSCSQRIIDPQLLIILPLENKALMTYGNKHSLHGCRISKSDPIVATAVYYRKADLVKGASKARTRSRSIVLSFSLTWLEEHLHGDEKERFTHVFTEHLSRFDWTLSPELSQIAEAINLTSSHCFSEKLLREALALAVWENMLSQFYFSTTTMQTSKQTNRLKQYLTQDKVQHMTLEEISKDLGMSISTLQRKVQQEFGISLKRYLRERALFRAKEALEDGKISLVKAAEQAGYQHISNFITAYRKLFGHPPCCRG